MKDQNNLLYKFLHNLVCNHQNNPLDKCCNKYLNSHNIVLYNCPDNSYYILNHNETFRTSHYSLHNMFQNSHQRNW